MKKKKAIFIIILFLLICGIGIGGSVIWIKQNESTTEEEITVKENQSLIVAQINTINGNEITFAEAEEVDLSSLKGGGMGENKGASENNGNGDGSSMDESQNGREQNASSKNAMDGQQMPQGGMGESQGQSGGNMPGGGDMPSGGMPGGGDMPSGGMPGGGDMPGGGEMSGGNDSGRSRTEDSSQEESGDKNEKAKNKTMYQVTGEEQAMLIPVGTAVTTQFGTTTTFSRLAAGDMVKILLEKNENNEDVIVGIWMIQ